MWLSVTAGVLVVLCIVGTIFSGGIFTIVTLPLAVIAVIAALASGAVGRIMQRQSGTPLPDAGSAGRPSTPDDLVDARQASQ